jgi:hypothetical protein
VKGIYIIEQGRGEAPSYDESLSRYFRKLGENHPELGAEFKQRVLIEKDFSYMEELLDQAYRDIESEHVKHQE